MKYNVLRIMDKKFYITTSIAYANAAPHIGYAMELIQADVLARYHKLLGEDVFFLTGTDEHGSKIARRAEELRKTPKEFTDEISKDFEKLVKVLNIGSNDFIRTTDQKRHWPNVFFVWKKLEEKRDIYKKKYKGLYCLGCEAFVKEKDLVNGKCPNHDKEPEIIEEENYFFKLSKPEYVSQIKKEIEENKINIIPEGRKNEILSFIEQGVEDVSISRSKENLKWGIPVPGDENQIIYIWFEALINYLFAKDKGYWPPDVHCIGKDIFRFHSLMWPVMLYAMGFERPKNIFVHGFITSNGQKMSKSLGNVVDPFELIEKYGADAIRYFLLREISPTEDGDFTEEKFRERYNADLAGGLGNLVARVIVLANKLKIQDSNLKTTIQNSKVEKEIKMVCDGAWENWAKSLESFKPNEALIAIWSLVGFCDRYIDKKQPWKKSDDQKRVIGDLLYVIMEISRMLQPFLPETSEKIADQFITLENKALFPRL